MALSGFLFKLKTPTGNKATQAGLPDLADFVDFGGIQSNSFNLSSEPIDITNKSTGQNRTLLDGHGTVSMEMSGTGFTLNNALHKEMQAHVLSQTHRWFLLERDDGRSFVAKCKLNSYSETGAHDGAVTFTLNLMSSGTIFIRDASGFKYDTRSGRITEFASQVANFDYILNRSENYALNEIPEPAMRASVLAQYITDNITLLNADKVSATPTDDISIRIDGARVYYFPIFFLEKSVIEGKKVQVLDVTNVNLTNSFKRLGEYDDDTSVTWVAFYLNRALLTGETSVIKIQIGD